MQMPQIIEGKKASANLNSVRWAKLFRDILSFVCAFWYELDNRG